MYTAALAFTAALASGSALTLIVRHFATRRGLLDHALTSRKAHGRPVPRLGGVAIVLAFFAPLVALCFVNSGVGAMFTASPRRVAGLFIGGLAIAALGLYDDLRGADARKKLAVQFLVAALCYALGYRIDAVTLPVLGTFQLGAFGLPLTMVWIAGVINAVNLIDGLDGLAGGVALVVLVALFSIAFGRHEALLMLVTGALAGAVLGFLFFNFNPASIFMGDTGSMFLGFVLATTSIRTSQKSSTAVAMLLPIVVLGLPIADTLLAMARRGVRGVPLFSADRGHIHHRLLARGLSTRQVALTLYAVTAVLGGVAWVLSRGNDEKALITLAFLGGGWLAFLHWLGFLDWAKLDELLQARRRNLARRDRVSELAARLQQAADPDAVAASLADAGPALAIEHVALKAGGRSWVFGASAHDVNVVRYGLVPERPGADAIEVGWHAGAEIDRDVEIAIEQLCGHVRAALQRIEAANDVSLESRPRAGSDRGANR